MMKHPVVVPAKPGEAPFLTLHLTTDEICNIIHRHLTRVAENGTFVVEFRSTRNAGHRGLTTTIHAIAESHDGQ